MIPPGYTTLQTLFSRLAKAEGERGDRIGAAQAAAARLRHSLVSGTVQAFRCDAAGAAGALPAVDWEMESSDFFREITRRTYTDYFVNDDIMNELCGAAGPTQSPEKPGETRGRKPLDPAKLCAAVALAVHDAGRQATQAKTIKEIKEAFDRLYGPGTAPGTSTLQPIANAVMKALRIGDDPAEK